MFTIWNYVTVDDEKWITIRCAKNVSMWIRETFGDQEDKTWRHHIDGNWGMYYNVIDMKEEIYTIVVLKWS